MFVFMTGERWYVTAEAPTQDLLSPTKRDALENLYGRDQNYSQLLQMFKVTKCPGVIFVCANKKLMKITSGFLIDLSLLTCLHCCFNLHQKSCHIMNRLSGLIWLLFLHVALRKLPFYQLSYSGIHVFFILSFLPHILCHLFMWASQGKRSKLLYIHFRKSVSLYVTHTELHAAGTVWSSRSVLRNELVMSLSRNSGEVQVKSPDVGFKVWCLARTVAGCALGG